MALKVEPDKLFDEVKAAIEVRDAHLERADDLIRRFSGHYFNSKREPDRQITLNFAFEFLSVSLPTIAYDNPRCVMGTEAPNVMDDNTRSYFDMLKEMNGVRSDRELAVMMGFRTVGEMVSSLGGFTMRQMAKGLQLSCNRWSIANEINGPLFDLAVDYFFTWGVGLTLIGDQPGKQGYEMAPQQPMLLRLPQNYFVMDASCMSSEVFETNGPRFKGHLWRADKEDLMNNPEFDPEQVELCSSDTDLEKYDTIRKHHTIPKRDEILAWDVWVPEHQLDGYKPEDGYNGSWHTVAVNHSSEGGTTKRAYSIRPPRPAYVPPWGSYTMIGYHKVPNDPYPLSLLVATAEQAESANAITTSVSEQARRYKKFGYSTTANMADAKRAQEVGHGEFTAFDQAEKIGEMEIGGVTQQMLQQRQLEIDGLDRIGGLSASRRGNPRGEVSATAEAIADAGIRTRTAGVQSRFRKGVARAFRTAAYFMFMGDDMLFTLGEEGEKHGIEEFRGGRTGRSAFSFNDLSLTIDPYSMEHTDQALIQKRLIDAFTLLRDSAPIIAQSPFIRWKEPISRLFEVMNINDAGDWLDEDSLAMIHQMAQMGSSPTENDPSNGVDMRLRGASRDDTNPYESQSLLQEAAGIRAAAL